MRKFISILKWALVMLINLSGFITAPVIFPLLYPFRKWISKIKPFWYYFDDEDGIYGSLLWREERGLKENFLAAYKWNALRNPAWNLQASLKPKAHYGDGAQLQRIVSYKGFLTRNGNEVSLPEFAVIKTEDKDGKYTDNFGKYFSYKYSIIGKMFIWYEVDGTLYWRFSKVWKGKRKWKEIQIGISDKRYLLRYKSKKLL